MSSIGNTGRPPPGVTGTTGQTATSSPPPLDAAQAQSLAARLEAGETLTTAELESLQQFLTTPAAVDQFSSQQRGSLEAFSKGSAPTRPGKELAPNLERVTQTEDVATRFSSDFAAVRDQLVDAPRFTSNERASRAFDFFSTYAQRFAELREKMPSQKVQQTQLSSQAQPQPQQEPQKHPAAQQAQHVQQVAPPEPRRMADDEPTVPEGRPALSETKGGERATSAAAARGVKEVPGVSVAESVLHSLAHEQPELSPEKLKADRKALLVALAELGFEFIRETTTGKDGLQFAQQLLRAKNPAEVAKMMEGRNFVSEGFPPNPSDLNPAGRPVTVSPDPLREAAEAILAQRHAASASSSEAAPQRVTEREPSTFRIPGFNAEASRQLVQGTDTRGRQGFESGADGDGDFQSRWRRYTHKRLGRQMLWNVLHRFRGEGEDSAIRKDVWDKIAFTALMALFGGAILVIILVSL